MKHATLCLLLLATSLQAEVKLPALFSDGMVLQQTQLVRIWGTADVGEDVKVSFGDQTHSSLTDPSGKWSITLNPMNANAQPADLVVAGKNTVTVKNVLVGEVWICSGQSNMQWTVQQAGKAQEEIAAANFPQIRMFNVERRPSLTPESDCKGAWKEANSTNVGEFSAVGYFFGRHLHQVLKVPVGLINTSWGGTRIEAWTSGEALQERPCAAEMLADWKDAAAKWDGPKEQAAFDQRKAEWQTLVQKIDAENAKLPADKKKPRPPAPRPPDDPNKTQHRPSVLFNGMVAPLIPYAVKGAIWYQGESNQKRAFQYQELLPTMINDWRKQWVDAFSFYIVQLANFGNGKPVATDPGVPDTWAELQEAQTLTAQTLDKCGIAIINDIGEQNDIHPKNKQEVGRRLALWALAKDYGKSGAEYCGPLYLSSVVQGDKVRVQFTHTGSGLKTRDGGEPKSFQISGADQKWVWAKAKIEGNEVVVWSESVPQPVGVRYAWASWPEGANLMNAEGLPASCFRTDDFLPSTLGVVSPFKENAPAKSAPAKP
ncbi:sialate O-acetylesterase [Prosthecobacter vanneervenii]|uniref:Sialate O-acetylesterase n=1 Tax=Prosthecobacter vanneervenii TaxID=48466 RepID=A0A7W7YAJ4_9BACT|nr:sialate O-acetylesterase [Prosthecobacter vanneervenii]MBB5032295.1 sialate O-acetylesterase [Prosthecobacter vanneervenii]